MLVEQAIYTSCQTSRASGYQLGAISPGIVDADMRELSLWGPSHDSLWEPGPAALSVNFHPLPSGAYCISQTTPAGAEYSQRRGPQVYTQCLVVDAAGLAEFANDPFALLQAAIALGHVGVLEKMPKRLDPFFVDRDPPHHEHDPLSQLLRHPGPVWLGVLLDRALASDALGIAAGERGASLVAALVQALPRECRPAFSFTTGLRFSPRRPFRLICLPNQAPENQRLARQQQFTLFECKGPPPETAPLGGWASFVTAAIASGNHEYLAGELERVREGLTLSHLNRLGDQLAAGLRALQGVPLPGRERPSVPNTTLRHLGRTAAGRSESAEGGDLWQRADGAHRQIPVVAAQMAVEHSSSQAAELLRLEEEPASVLGEACPQAMNDLQRLEDALFEALAGKTGAVEHLALLWPAVLSQVGPARHEETREHYLRYALSVWHQLNEADGRHDPARALQAMHVVCLIVEP